MQVKQQQGRKKKTKKRKTKERKKKDEPIRKSSTVSLYKDQCVREMIKAIETRHAEGEWFSMPSIVLTGHEQRFLECS